MKQQSPPHLTDEISIVKYSPIHREQIPDVWEKSVLATHDFLKAHDFEEIRTVVHTIDFNDFEVYCLVQNTKVLGFIALADKKIEMLFLLPGYIGKGHGKKLIDFTIQKLQANKVDVNEQNTNAVTFYERLGFKTYERTDKDDQGRDYPLLRMKLPGMD